MSKKILTLVMVILLLVLAACGQGKPAGEAAEIVVDGDGDAQNPVMNFVGDYQADRASMLVEAEGADTAKFTVHWGSSAWESSEWVMSGKLDPETLTVAYDNCVRTDRVYTQDGADYTDTVAYEKGAGRVVFHPEDNSITWEDDQEHIADGKTFGFVPTGEAPTGIDTDPAETATDPDHYKPVTALPADQVESMAAQIRKAYLDEDWAAIADLIDYPISIYKTELKDKDAFLNYMSTATVAEADRKVMEEEDCRDLFVNGQGICMGSGQVWLNDKSYMTDQTPDLKIIALSGIEGEAEPSPTPAPSAEPTPGANAKLPKVTKSPTDENVAAGGSCWFVAKYENAIWAEWHFVSPDGKTDLAYDKIDTQFPDLKVVEGYASTTRLKNIPKEMDGWRVYCRFSNRDGGVNTEMATIRIKEGAVPDTSLPKVTKSPTGETVEKGGSCWFVADHKDAIYAEWHFVSPDGNTDLKYDKVGTEFPNLKVVNGNRSAMQLKNIPVEMNGWKVYCRFSNDNGSVETQQATISIKGEAAPVTGVPKVTKSPTGETVEKGGSCWFVAKADNATRVEWYFVAPDGNNEVKYTDIGSTFSNLKVIDGDAESMQLKNVPAEMNGWQVYCHFSNALGSADTDRAKISIKGAATPTPAPSTAPAEENDNYYSGVTAMTKSKVEEFAATVRKAYLEKDWQKLSAMIRYPITILNTELKDADAFLAFMADKTIAESDAQKMEAETCKDMFANGQGICLGSGQVWLNDMNYMTDKTPELKIIALSGIESK